MLRGFALPDAGALVDQIGRLSASSPFRHMITRGGKQMSVAMLNTGTLGWVSDVSGYRYDPIDPETCRPWPPLTVEFLTLARRAATMAGYKDFTPDACLVNRYAHGARLTLHQDIDEHDPARIQLDGPTVLLGPRLAQPLALVLHELMENALAHGALSEAEGTLAVRWRGDNGRATLGWQEHGSKAITAPKRSGFGIRTIEGVIKRQLGGSVTLSWTQSGLNANFAFNTEASATQSAYEVTG